MTQWTQYEPSPANGAELRLFWCDRMDALERHLSATRWAIAAVTALLVAYPIARMVIPAVLHAIVPDVVRTALNFI